MAFTVNGIQVAGSGKSAYLYALAGGYTGTEEDFNKTLLRIVVPIAIILSLLICQPVHNGINKLLNNPSK